MCEEPLIRRSTKTENWVVVKPRSRHPGTIKEWTLTYLKNAHKGCVPLAAELTFSWPWAQAWALLPHKNGSLVSSRATGFQEACFHTTKHMSSYKRKKSSQAFCTAIVSSLFFCRALSFHPNAHWVPQILVFVPVLRIKVPGFTIQFHLSKLSWFPNPFCSAHILKRIFLALFLF